MPDFAYDVFLSHNRAQKDWTRQLGRQLRDEGFKVWFGEWCLRGGENWIVGLRRGVKESRHVVFVVSPESMDAVWPRFEVYLAIFHDPAADDRKLIPIIHSRCELPDEIAFRQCIDFCETHGYPVFYEFKLLQLMADLDPSRERPTDFELWVQEYEAEEFDGIPPVRPLPPGSLMPLRPNPHFVGREDELQELERHLRAGSATAIGQVAAATGLGGIGKTQLAAEYAHRYGPRYRGGVFWLDMEDQETIASQVARCGGLEGMDLPGFDALSLEEQLGRVKKVWEESTPRLLIFDNVVDSEVVSEWRPVTGGCRALITSRRTDWPTSLGIQEVRLSTLPREKAIELLCKGRPEALEDEEEAEAADAICETLGDLPLAVALAGAYLETYKHDVTLAQYLQDLRAQAVLENPALVDFVQDPSPTDHVQSVAATFDASYRRLDPADETDLLAMRLFHLASHFAPVYIRRDLFFASAGLDPEVQEERRLAVDAVERLVQLGLIEEEVEGRLLLHRLLGEFARHRPAPGQSEGEAWVAVAESVQRFASRENRSGLPAGLTRELPHLAFLTREAGKRHLPGTALLLSTLGYHLRMVGSLREARRCFEGALTIGEVEFGKDHPKVAIHANNLGTVLLDLGEPEAARKSFERAVGIAEVVYGKDHRRVAEFINNLGQALGHLGDLEGARQCSERALEILERIHGKDHPEVATAVNNLGGVRFELGDLKGAMQCFDRALKITESALGSDHPDVAAILNNVGMVRREQGDKEGARESFVRVVAICRGVYGEVHPTTQMALDNLKALGEG